MDDPNHVEHQMGAVGGRRVVETRRPRKVVGLLDEDEKALPRWVEALFAFMQRNSAHLTEYFKLPVEAVVEIGREVSI